MLLLPSLPLTPRYNTTSENLRQQLTFTLSFALLLGGAHPSEPRKNSSTYLYSSSRRN